MMDPLVVDWMNILLVEDNVADQFLIREALGSLSVKIHHVSDGEQALIVLQRSAPRPDAIILDQNLPRITGRELLDYIRTDEVLRPIPVLVFTTSTSPRDSEEMRLLGRTLVHAKPTDPEAYFSVVRAFVREVIASTLPSRR